MSLTEAATTTTTTLSSRLITLGTPHVDAWQELPLVAAIVHGDADPDVFRNYLQQDYLYITSYVRLYAKLAGGARDADVAHLVQMAWNLVDVELGHHEEMGKEFGCTFDGINPSEVCREYTEFLHRSADDFGLGLVAALPCIWGYGLLCNSIGLPPVGMYRDWVEVYRGDRYQHLVDKHCAMLDAAVPDPDQAEEVFLRGLAFEVEFWNQLP